MTFIKLTASDDEEPIYINPETISAVYYYDEMNCTIVHVTSGDNFAVKDSPEAVTMMSRFKQISL